MRHLLTWPRIRRARQAIQILALAFYLYLLFATLRRAAFPLADLFFRLNPLAALTAMLAARAWIPRLALALLTLALTLLAGRVWCGWLCPLGTLLDVRLRKGGAGTVAPAWRKVKYALLLLILTMALFGSLHLLIFDPIALLTRAMTTGVLPALHYGVTAVEHALYTVLFLRPAVNGLESALRGTVFPVKQPVFGQNLLLAALLLGVLSLNWLADRFWCRYLCPLGALLGLLSRAALWRPFVRPACHRCGHCLRACRLGAIDTARGYEIAPDECTVCLDCLSACPADGMAFSAPSRLRVSALHGASLTRRQALVALAGGAVSVALLRTGPRARHPSPRLLRPPGVQDEAEFLARCLRCSQCMKVCPTTGLQPAGLEAGLEGLWTPRLTPRLGHCEYGCNACGQVCPSGAIPPLPLARKRETVIGMAVVDRNRCLPWAYGVPCIVCEEMCPMPEKAIRLEEARDIRAQGEEVTVQRPYVVLDLCIGCGICEKRCPLEGEAAIRVYRR